jgi:hypothetical protein
MDYLPYAQKIIKEGYTLPDMSNSDREASDITSEVIDTRNKRNMLYVDFKNIHPN